MIYHGFVLQIGGEIRWIDYLSHSSTSHGLSFLSLTLQCEIEIDGLAFSPLRALTCSDNPSSMLLVGLLVPAQSLRFQELIVEEAVE